MALVSGTKLGPYGVLSLLGAGGMGEVYRGRDFRLGREIAIKVLPSGFAASPETLQRFEREARAVSALNHPNICTLFDVGCHDGTHFIIMELLEGRTLREVISDQRMAFATVLSLSKQIASAIEAVHSHGIIHRDIKPGNIFVTGNGVAKLLDFGLAKFQSAAQNSGKGSDETLTLGDLTTKGLPIGTVAYMSPEQTRGRPTGFETDLFSLGAVLYEMATSQRASPGDSPAEIFAAILNESPLPPSSICPSIPRHFDGVVMRLLEKSPARRYRSARELIAALEVISSTRELSPEIQPVQHVQATAAREEHTSLAVLPVLDLSPSPGQDYFVDGLTEALITAVARLNGVRVISRTSAFCYKHTQKSLPVIAQELNVDSVLEGSVLRSGEKLRLTCRLIESRCEQLIWSESFDCNLQDILSLHDEVAQAVAAGIRASMRERSASPSTPEKLNPECYDSYLRGRYFWNKRDESNLKKAIEWFQHALDLDPLYAPAYSGIADSYFYLGYSFGRMNPKDAMPLAKANALRALELNPRLAEGYCSLALVQTCFDWDWPAAESNFRRAIEMNPSLATSRHFYAILLSALRRNQDALAQINTAMQSDPLSLPINNMVGMMYFAARQFDSAIAALRKTLEMNPKFGLSRSVLGAALEAKGLEAEAAEEYLSSLEVGQHRREDCAAIRRAFEERGLRGLHEEDLRHFLRQWHGWASQMFDIAALHSGLGQRSEALDWLERAYDARAGRLVWINSGASFSRIAEFFDGLREESRFISLLNRLQLPI